MRYGIRILLVLAWLSIAVALPACGAPAPEATPAATPLPAPAATPGSPALDVVGHLNVAAGPGHITDVWALTARDGRSFAYLGSFDQPYCDSDITGVHIVDITDPANPQRAGFIPSPSGTRANDVKVEYIETPFFSGDILIHSVESCVGDSGPPGGAGIVIYDVTDPTVPRVLARDFLDFEVHNTFIYQRDESALALVVANGAAKDFVIVDITDPSTPVQVSTSGGTDWFDSDTDQLSLGAAPVSLLHDVWAQVYPEDFPNASLAGRAIAYLPYWDAGLVLIDITDPSRPVFLGDSDYLAPDPLSGKLPEGNSHVAVPTADGELMFMGDEDFSPVRTIFAVDTGGFAAEYVAREAEFTIPLGDLEGRELRGPTTFVGLGCDADAVVPPAPATLELGEVHVALIERGGCEFDEKISRAAEAGYGGAIVFNQEDAAGLIMSMGGDSNKGTIPAVFVTRFTAFALLGISPESPASTPLPPAGTLGQRISARGGVVDGWGYARVLDVSDPADIVELGQFATENVLRFPVPPGDHSMHNVVVEGRRAYVSWYADGIRVVDFSNPEDPREIAHFLDAESGSNFWGVYLFDHPDGNAYILGSDRDTGLWVLETP